MLSLWASPNTVDGKNMTRFLFHFVTPAAIITSLCVLLTNFIFKRLGTDIAYTQQVITHLLMLVGLFLVIFAQPPVRFLVAGDDFNGKWQIAIAALVLYAMYNLTTLIPLAQRLLRIAPLQSMRDYLLIIVITLLWAILVVGVWRMVWPERYMHSKPQPDVDYSGKGDINPS